MTESSTTFLLANSDSGIGTIILILLVVAVTIVQKLVEMFKEPKKTPPNSGDKTEYKPIREMLEDMDWEKTLKKEHPPAPPTQIAPRRAKPLPKSFTTTHVEPFVKQKRASMPEKQEAIQLSDVEKEALARLQNAPATPVSSPAPVVQSTAYANATLNSHTLKTGLSHAETLRAAILYHEVLGKPLALRDH